MQPENIIILWCVDDVSAEYSNNVTGVGVIKSYRIETR